MKLRHTVPACSIFFVLFAFCFRTFGASNPVINGKQIPDPLKSWQDWVTWNDVHKICPPLFNDSGSHLCFWPGRLNLDFNRNAGRFELHLKVYHSTWITLPGNKDLWPLEVTANGSAIAVIERIEKPSIRLEAGDYQITGSFRYDNIPQNVLIPTDVGVVSLSIEGRTMESPVWDNNGVLWLKRAKSEETNKDFLDVKVYRVIEDGIPMWLRTEMELSVAGKSREEALGSVIPEGWKLSRIESLLPASVDDQGRIKVQVRSGKWFIHLDSFRLDHAAKIQYPAEAKPVASQELVGFKAKPDFRITEVVGIPSIDVSQTSFPQGWREFPVYLWETKSDFRLEERMRGAGLFKPEGLTIHRELWWDEDGKGVTFKDKISGKMQQIWRLDAAENENLGSVQSNGQGQLITKNPKNGASGVEIRDRNLELEATGRIPKSHTLSASGWQSDADRVAVDLNIPPGWRLFAVFGADHVAGDWLTAWTLLDLFLLLIFSMAMYRLEGFKAGLLALLAFGLSYREPDAPRYLWLVLLIPVALLKVVPEGWSKQLIKALHIVCAVLLLVFLVPFIGYQIQQALHPQLEKGHSGELFRQQVVLQSSSLMMEPKSEAATVNGVAADSEGDGYGSFGWSTRKSAKHKGYLNSNLAFEANAKIQTGPGVPQWTWRSASYYWNGPVSGSQTVRPIMLSANVVKILTIIRIGLLILLAGLLLKVRGVVIPALLNGQKSTAGTLLLLFGLFVGIAGNANAQIPDKDTLNLLKERLMEPSDAFPNAADIPVVTISIKDRTLITDAEIHTAVPVAVPLPGRLPSWSPVSVLINGKSEAVVCRKDGYLWVSLPAGVNKVQVKGVLPNVTEWELSFLLKPRKVVVEAADWTVNGVRSDNVPEQQIFFVRKQKATTDEASYDRQNFNSVAVVNRRLELGIVWQVHNEVVRLSPTGKALMIRVPLLPGEKVLSSDAAVGNGTIDIRLGANENSASWESELTPTSQIDLTTKKEDAWVESWYLMASPIWNVSFTGLAPVFGQEMQTLVPTWQPWPGEKVQLTISRPEAINGATVTVHQVNQAIQLGSRQRTTELTLDLQASLGEDFSIVIPPDAQITALKHNGTQIPVRKDGDKIIVPLKPGRQSLLAQWKIDHRLNAKESADVIKLPVEASNIQTTMEIPESRWVLWTQGPLRGPAVRLWTVLIFSILAAFVLGRLSFSPLSGLSWVLLSIGLTQVPLAAGLAILFWLFLLSWRGMPSFQSIAPWKYNLMQFLLVILTIAALGVFISIVAAGLLGQPEIFIAGNESTSHFLKWYQPRVDGLLPRTQVVSISIWWYRFAMLLWALWLTSKLISWLKWGWKQFGVGGYFRTDPDEGKPTPPPPAIS